MIHTHCCKHMTHSLLTVANCQSLLSVRYVLCVPKKGRHQTHDLNSVNS